MQHRAITEDTDSTDGFDIPANYRRHRRWYESRRYQAYLTIAGLIIASGFISFIIKIVRLQDEAHIVSTVCASPAVEGHFRAIIKEVSRPRDSVSIFNNMLLLEHCNAGEKVRAHERTEAIMSQLNK